MPAKVVEVISRVGVVDECGVQSAMDEPTNLGRSRRWRNEAVTGSIETLRPEPAPLFARLTVGEDLGRERFVARAHW